MKVNGLIRFIRFSLRQSPWRTLLAILPDACTILFSAGLYGVAAFLISLAAMRPPFEVIMLPVVGVRFFGLGRAVLRYAERLVSHDTTFRILRNLRVYIYDKLESRLPEHGNGIKRGNLVAEAVSDVENLQEAFLKVLYPWLVAFGILFAGLFTALMIHPSAAAAFALLYLPAAFFIPVRLVSSSQGAWKSAMELKYRLYGEFLEFSYGLKEILSNGREADWRRKIEKTLSEESEAAKRNHRYSAAANSLSSFLQGFSLCTFIVLCCWLSSKGELPGEYLAASALTLAAFFEGAVPVIPGYARVEKVAASAERVFGSREERWEQPGKTAAGSKPGRKPLGPHAGSETSDLPGCLSIRNLSFSHPLHPLSSTACQNRRILDSFSLDLRKGQIKAIVGPSGIGKSTVLNLVLGFLQPDSGWIKVDEEDLAGMDMERRRSLFSVVDQRPYFFHDSLRENMRVANPEARDEDILEACRRACILDLVAQLPRGLDTLVAESGVSLSAGEIQRLAIARALLKDAPFYFFDEPSAGLDTVNEKKLVELFLELKRDKGVLIITHRKGMLEQMDEVVRFEADVSSGK